jgi:hypothetical protein
MITKSLQFGLLILKCIIRISLIAIAIPWAIYKAADYYIITSFSAEDLAGDFGFKLGMMVLGTWVSLTFLYYNFCILYWFFKRKYIRVLLWFLFLFGPPLWLLVTSKYDFSVTQAFFMFNTPYYVGHAALAFLLNVIPFTRVRPVITLPKAVDTSTPG